MKYNKTLGALICTVIIVLFSNTVFATQPPINAKIYWVGTIGQPRRVDPARAYDTASGELIMNVYETLIRFNETKILRTDVDTPYYYTRIDSFEPLLADWWTVSEDGLTWTFHIREGVKFHDWVDRNGVVHSGELLTPEDVEYSFERGLVQDQYGSPMWMLYLPLTGEHNSDVWDLDGDGVLNATEEAAAAEVLKNVITRDDGARTVTFHFAFPFPKIAFMQILSQTWGSIVNKKFAVDYGCWPGTWEPGWSHWRRYPSNAYSPLDRQVPEAGDFPPNRPTPPAMCGTGPYKFTYWDKTKLEWRVDKFKDYWRGWPAKGNPDYIETVIVRGVEEWTTRKMLFLSGDFDSIYVPRANMFELLTTEDPKSSPLTGITCFRDIEPVLANDAIFFNFKIAEGSPYVGTGKFPDGIPPNFFANTKVRQAFAYAIDFETLINDAWFGEAIQPTTWWVKGLAPDYEDTTLEKYSLNLEKVEQLLKEATFTQDGVTKSVWEWGFKFTLLYNIGNDQRKIANELLISAIESLNAKRPGLPPFEIENLGLDWPVYLDALEVGTMPAFQIGWLADFADADNFVRPFMHSLGDFTYYQSVWEDPNYDTAYIDDLIERGIKTPDGPEREAVYKELQRLYHDLVPSIPTVQPLGRRWQRFWVQGWYYNALYPGLYFYHLWKGYAPPPPPPPVSASIVYGTSVTIAGSFIDPATNMPASSILTFVQYSNDNVTWTNIYAAITDKNGRVSVTVTPPLGISYYRLNSTGYIAPLQPSVILNAEFYEELIANGTLGTPRLMSEIGQIVKVETKSIEDILTSALGPMATKSDLNSFSQSLSAEIADLRGSISSLTTLIYVSAAISIIAIILAVVSLARKRG
ncbi:ABC transporter substrate-binding protein [Candidatus Bathyarchaeota archaeon]|nr:ABC transporter substrate-binding protein [Candidatus Bathyarchaeota archaeon]